MKKNYSNKKRIFIIVLAVTVVVLACIAGLMYYKQMQYYGEHFYSGTVINSVDCSDMTVEDVESSLQRFVDEYTLTVTDRDGRSYELTAAEIEMTYKSDGTIAALLSSQNSLLWITNINDPISDTVDLSYAYNSDMVSVWLSSLTCVLEGEEPVDAYEYMADDGYWYISAESEGSLIDFDTALEYIIEAINSGEGSVTLYDDCYVMPSVYSTDSELIASVNTKNSEVEREKYIQEITDVTVSLVISGDPSDSSREIITSTLDQETLLTMIEDDENGTPVVSQDQVINWVTNWATENDLINDQYLFITYSGSLVHLSNGSDYGWQLDVEATAEAVYEAVTSKTSTIVRPVLTSVDDGTTLSEGMYIEIIIPEQRMILYQDGEIIVDTSVVTGCVENGTETPSNGIWHIYSMRKNYTLKGYYKDGTLEYSTKVEFWMPFNKIGVGIHDMQSRTEFGGNIYIANGSHGCINTPYDAAKQIFELAEIGTKVIVWG